MRERILVVDDNEICSKVLCHHLRDEGYDIQSASSCAQALQMLQSQPHSMVISDLVLGRDSGLELLRRIRAQGQNLPFLMVSGDEDESVRAQARQADAQDFLNKPVPPEVLRRKVKEAICSWRQQSTPSGGRFEGRLKAFNPDCLAILERWST